MKQLLAFFAIFSFAIACSSPKEKRAEREVEAQEEYEESMKEAQEEYKEENLDQQKEEAEDMIDESNKVETDPSQGTIQTDD